MTPPLKRLILALVLTGGFCFLVYLAVPWLTLLWMIRPLSAPKADAIFDHARTPAADVIRAEAGADHRQVSRLAQRALRQTAPDATQVLTNSTDQCEIGEDFSGPTSLTCTFTTTTAWETQWPRGRADWTGFAKALNRAGWVPCQGRPPHFSDNPSPNRVDLLGRFFPSRIPRTTYGCPEITELQIYALTAQPDPEEVAGLTHQPLGPSWLVSGEAIELEKLTAGIQTDARIVLRTSTEYLSFASADGAQWQQNSAGPPR